MRDFSKRRMPEVIYFDSVYNDDECPIQHDIKILFSVMIMTKVYYYLMTKHACLCTEII